MELELVTKNYRQGKKWKQTCTPWGTPGQDRVYPCSFNCDKDKCQSQGLDEARCVSVDDFDCDCTDSQSYFNLFGVCTES